MLSPSNKRAVLEALRQQLKATQRPIAPTISSGCYALDRILPDHSFHRGTLIEFLADAGSGAASFAIIAARESCRDGGTIVVVDPRRSLYPPAAANLGIGLNTIFVRPRTKSDQLWALNQSLSCKGVGAVLCWADKLDSRAFRSLQLAAENGGAVGLFVRPLSVRGHPTWSELQLLIEPLPAATKSRRLRVTVIRCRNGQSGASVDLELDDETGRLIESRSVPVAPAMVIAESANRAAGA